MRKNILLASTICFVLTVGVLAQSKPMATPPKVLGRPQCTVPYESAPVIRGLKLGLSENEAAELLGDNLEFEYNKDTWTRKATQFSALTNRPKEFEGIGFIELESYNTDIFRFALSYSSDIKWNSVREFADNFAPKLGLPTEGWESDYVSLSLTCQDFVVRLRAGSSGVVEVTDLRTVRRIAEDMKKTDAERKKAIKP